MKLMVLLFLSVPVYCCLTAREITIAAAANVQYAAADIVDAFERNSGIEVKTVFGSSGKLTAQIRNDAPFDVFLSADMAYPDTLYAAGFAAAKPAVYAFGALVLWTNSELPLDNLESLLRDERLRRLAIANPRLAPYGAQAVNVLKYYGLYTALEPKLIYGSSVAQVNHYVFSGAAEAGFTALASVLSPNLKGQGKWMAIDAAAYQPIAQGALLLRSGSAEGMADARQFYDFLFSETARKILTQYGYTLP